MKEQGLGTEGLGTSHPSEQKSLAGDPGKDQEKAKPAIPVATIPGNGAPLPLKAAPLAYENLSFLNSADGRPIRIVSEYLEPLARIRREKILDTVVFFGSARFRGREEADHTLELLENTGSREPRPAMSNRPRLRRLPPARQRICSASAPWRPWRWPATTRTRGGWRIC